MCALLQPATKQHHDDTSVKCQSAFYFYGAGTTELGVHSNSKPYKCYSERSAAVFSFFRKKIEKAFKFFILFGENILIMDLKKTGLF